MAFEHILMIRWDFPADLVLRNLSVSTGPDQNCFTVGCDRAVYKFHANINLPVTCPGGAKANLLCNLTTPLQLWQQNTPSSPLLSGPGVPRKYSREFIFSGGTAVKI